MNNFDLFASRPEFNLNGREKSSSNLGLVLSFFTAVILGLLAYLFGKELWDRKNPNVVPSTLTNAILGEEIQFSPEDFAFGLFHIAQSVYYVDPTIFYIEAKRTIPGSDPQYIKLNVCEADPELTGYPGQIFCVDESEENVAKLKTSDLATSYITISVFTCKNETLPADADYVCKDTPTIEGTMIFSWFAYRFRNIGVDVTNYETPLKYEFQNIAYAMIPAYTKSRSLFMKKVEFITDNGVLFESKHTETGFALDNMVNDINNPIMHGGARNVLYFLNGGNVQQFIRSYMKLQDVLANISGFMSAILLIISFIALRYSRFKMYETLANEGYSLVTKKNLRSKTISKAIGDKMDRRRAKMARKMTTMKSINPAQSEEVGLQSEQPPGNGTAKFYNEDKPNIKVKQEDDHSRFPTDNEDVHGIQIEVPQIDVKENANSPRKKKTITDSQIVKQDSNTFTFPTKTEPSNNKKEKKLEHTEYQKVNTLESPAKKYYNGTDTPDVGSPNNSFARLNQRDEANPLKYLKIVSAEESTLKERVAPEDEFDEKSPEIHIDLAHNHHQKVEVKWWEWASSLVKKHHNVKVVEKASQQVDNILDVLKIIKRFIQLERLAYILLDDHQKVIFDNLPRPVLELSEDQPETQADLLHSAIKRVLNKPELSTADVKLLELYEKSV